jgi:Tfp pilus assembly protein PilZ
MVVKEPEARAAYEEALKNVGAAYDVAASFHEVMRLSTEQPYSGLLIDILTLIRCSKEEKTIAYDCINYYPSLRVKWDARNGSMNLSPLEGSGVSETTLCSFIETRCKPFTARSLRKFQRKDLVLSLLLSTRPECGESDCLKSFTANLSLGGAFVHTTTPQAKGERVWLRFLDLPELDPLEAEVCWCIEWGTCRSIPGIGVRFSSISEEQLQRLKKIGGL